MNHKLDEIKTKEVVDYNGTYYYEVGVTSGMSQDVFYTKATNGKHIYDLTDAVYKEIKNDKNIISLPHYHNCYNGDDFYAIDILFTIGKENEVELVEL
mgnify:CR=1 FL=1